MRVVERVSWFVFLTFLVQTSTFGSEARAQGDCVQGSGTRASAERAVGGFTEVDVSGAFTVHLTAGKPFRVVVSADDNIVAHVITEVRGTRLVVSLDEGICPKQPLQVDIDLDKLEVVTTSGSAVVDASGVDSQALNVATAGAGTITLAGQASRLKASLSGAGTLHAYELSAPDVEVGIQGKGDAEVHATNRLRGSIVGMGNIRYAGHPKDVEKSITGIGDIEPR